MRYGVYEVTGKREYRGHKTGDEFEAIHDPAIGRAIARGDIKMLRSFTPSVQDGSIRGSDDWFKPLSNQDAKRRLSKQQGG